jgi:Uma2 family endonuclease
MVQPLMTADDLLRLNLPDQRTEAPRGFATFAPDLVVEVLSPGDRPGDVLAKVADWLTAGVLLVWVVDPVRRLARVYRADGTETVLQPADQLDGESVLPGFTCPVETVV